MGQHSVVPRDQSERCQISRASGIADCMRTGFASSRSEKASRQKELVPVVTATEIILPSERKEKVEELSFPSPRQRGLAAPFVEGMQNGMRPLF